MADWGRQLSDPNKVIRREAAYQLSRAGGAAVEVVPALVKALDDSEQQVWFGSVVALANIGPGASNAIPALMRGLTRKGQREARQVWYRSSYALSRIGVDALPPLIDGLKSEDPLMRAGCAQSLGWIGLAASNAIPNLLANLGDGNPDSRKLSAETLTVFGTNVLRDLAPLISHANEDVRASVAYAISRIGPQAASVAPAVFEQLQDEKMADARSAQFDCLTRLKFRRGEFLELSLRQMSDQDLRIRHAAAEAIIGYPGGPSETIPLLEKTLGEEDAFRRERAAVVLSRLGHAAAPAAMALVRAAQRPGTTNAAFVRALVAMGDRAIDPVVHGIERETLENLGPGHWAVQALSGMGPLHLSRFEGLLQSESKAARLAGLETLRLLGREASGSQKKMEAILQDSSPHLRARALAALMAVSRRPAALMPHIERSMQDADSLVRSEATAAVAQLGPSARSMVPLLVHALKDPSPEVQIHAARALGALGTDAEPAAPALSARLRESAGALRAAIIQALGRLGPAAAEALPELTLILDGDSDELRVAALQTLGGIGRRASESADRVVALCTNSVPAVRAAAVAVIGRIQEAPEPLLKLYGAAVEDPEGVVRKAAAEGFGRLGQAAQGHAPKLFAMLNNAEERAAALDGLRRIRSQSVPHFVEALSNGDPGVRVFACESLGAMGKSATNAVPALKKALNDSYDFVRRQARQALKSIEGAEPAK